jgi:hypothetical protein
MSHVDREKNRKFLGFPLKILGTYKSISLDRVRSREKKASALATCVKHISQRRKK